MVRIAATEISVPWKSSHWDVENVRQVLPSHSANVTYWVLLDTRSRWCQNCVPTTAPL